jgi:putative transposase
MGRKPRVAAAGFHHVWSRGNNQRAIFLDDADRLSFLERIGKVLRRFGWRCHVFVLLTNHFHLLVETPDETLPNGLQRLKLATACAFNHKYGTTGHLFEAPYGSELVTRQGHAAWLVRYLAMNPVQAGLCERPEDWLWSSYRATIGLGSAPAWLTRSWVLGLFSEDEDVARGRLRAFVDGTRSR